ncbi:hypothetical protein PMIN04_002212 [Paraphaeosphaeria minitans]|uniref:Uncharacterized protein n=1 Tax=Paraphaeosphaeria minitans TaxID=565426 RepID=A0A9P6GQA7_9PLEO|nr:hypothetical protein PMIN01_01789 [Paraphaeosphaeria minitans]
MADTASPGPTSITLPHSMPLPPPISFVNTGYIETSDEEDAIKDYDYMDPTDGKPFISAETSAEDKRVWQSYMSRGQDEEMPDADDQGWMEMANAYDYGMMMNTGGTNQVATSVSAIGSTTVRKRPGKASRVLPSVAIGLSLLDREDPSNIDLLFQRPDKSLDHPHGDNAARIGQQEFSHHLDTEWDVTPFEFADDSNTHQNGHYGQMNNGESNVLDDAYYAGMDYHSHASLLANSNQPADFKKERARKRRAGVQPCLQNSAQSQEATQMPAPRHTHTQFIDSQARVHNRGPCPARGAGRVPELVQTLYPTSSSFAAPGTPGTLPVRQEIDSNKADRKRKINKVPNPHFKMRKVKRSKLSDQQNS